LRRVLLVVVAAGFAACSNKIAMKWYAVLSTIF
jgi:hypothetical protein